MKTRPPRKKNRVSLPGVAYEVLKNSKKSLALKDLYTLVERNLKGKADLSLSALHTELNLDGRFIYLNDKTWALKSRVPNLKREDLDDFDLLEVEYEPVKEDYKWSKEDNSDDDTDDESELLVPYDGEEMELDDDESEDEESEEFEESEDEDDDYPTKK